MPSFFSGKKILLFGFIFVILLVIPLTVYLLQKQQEVRSRANPATTLSFSPDTPQNTTVGQKVSFDIFLDPSTNQVSFAKLTISYDDKKLTADASGLQINTSQKLSNILEGPTLTPSNDTSPATISITLSVGADPTAVIQSKTKIATLTLTTKDVTDQTGTKIKFVGGNQTQILSIGSSDASNENVLLLSSLSPATVVIGQGLATNLTPTAGPTQTPTPTSVNLTPTPTVSPTPTTTAQSGGVTNQPPSCTALNLDKSSNGTAPYSIAFTAIGSDTNGTISKVTFNFGDGPSQDVTQGGGIGAASVQTQIAHTYKNPGTYRATATLTDNNNAISDPNACSQTITVNSAPTSQTGTTTQSQAITAPPQTPSQLPPTGPKELIIGGIAGGILSVIGVVLLLSL